MGTAIDDHMGANPDQEGIYEKNDLVIEIKTNLLYRYYSSCYVRIIS